MNFRCAGHSVVMNIEVVVGVAGHKDVAHIGCRRSGGPQARAETIVTTSAAHEASEAGGKIRPVRVSWYTVEASGVKR